MKKTNLFRKTVSIAAAAAALVTAFTMPVPKTATAADDVTETAEEETLPNKLMNGDFEIPLVADVVSKNYPNASYQSSQPWIVTEQEHYDEVSNNQFYWKTTSFDKRIELETIDGTSSENMRDFWCNKTTNNINTDPGSGKQFAELVAEEKASLYQNIKTEPGSVLSWSLMHRGRIRDDGVNDTMALFIGPKQEGELGKTGKDADDLFMLLAGLLVDDSEFETLTVGMSGPHTLYSKKLTKDVTDITADDKFVSDEPGEGYTEEWTCWIITDDYLNWGTYSGNYTVPTGQEATIFAFTPLTGITTNNPQTQFNEGNCLDNIDFGVLYPLTVTALEGGSGEVIVTEDNNETEVPVASGTTFEGFYDEDVTVTFSAEPEDDYTFIGAYIDGVYHDIGQFDSKTKQVQTGTNWWNDQPIYENRTYYEYTGNDITMNTAHEITLLFAQNQTVTYYANGGVFEDGDSISTETFTYYNYTHTGATPPTKDKADFLGWKLYVNNSEIKPFETELVPEAHWIYYTSWRDTSLTINDENYSRGTEISDNADDAVLFVAQWGYTATVQPCTMSFGDNDYTHNSSVGGTASFSGGGDSIGVSQGDTFTAMATAAPGYQFEGWYAEDESGNLTLLSKDLTYNGTYNYSESVTLHAHFSEIPITPYLSAVAESEGQEGDLETITVGHGNVAHKDSENNPIYQNNETYGDLYGNTISTGFFATRSFGTGENGAATISGTWTINIPANGTYIKSASSNEYTTGGAVVSDSSSVEYNNGTIYKANDTIARQVKFYVDGTTVVSGGGEVVFGIVIDNLYAPQATAGFRAGENTEEVPELNNSNSVTVVPPDEYDPTALDELSGSATSQTID